MSEESGGSAITWLIYALAVYWIASSWRAHLARILATEDVRPKREGAADAHSIASLPDRAASLGRDAVLSEILRSETVATIDEFLTKTLALYERIVAVFDSGDRETLAKLVSPDVYKAFERAITDREVAGTIVETVFARLDPPEIIDGSIDATHVMISVRFAGEVFNLSRDAAGQLTEKAPTARRSVDVWTFARKLRRGSNWRLVATQIGP